MRIGLITTKILFIIHYRVPVTRAVNFTITVVNRGGGCWGSWVPNCLERFSDISTLGVAIVENNIEEVENLLSAGCDPNYKDARWSPACNMHHCGWEGYPYTSGLSNLHIAVLKQNIPAVKILLKMENIVVDTKDEDGCTPLDYAGILNRARPLLLQHGAQ